ncbi:MAG: amidohydrolase family protein, partial [Saprospiraceae bacterium]|nr:amidohydrolase family protein [Saprospiraceae bacterium]
IMTLEQFIPLLTNNPAKFIGVELQKGKLAKGYDADFTIWNPEEEKVVSADDILFRHKISPYIGTSLYGTVVQTIVNGTTVFENNNIINSNKGLWLLHQ